MFHKALLLFLPAVAYANMDIEIVMYPTNTEYSSNKPGTHVRYLGFDLMHLLPPVKKYFIEESTWQIFDEEVLKDAAQAILGNRPERAYLNTIMIPPFPIFSLHEQHGWENVHRVLLPHGVWPHPIKYETVILATENMLNKGLSNRLYSPSKLRRPIVNETMTTTWSTGGKLRVKEPINYNFVVRKLCNWCSSTNMTFTSHWGENTTISHTVTLDFDEIPPSQILRPDYHVDAAIMATKGTWELELNYTASLKGTVACQYETQGSDTQYLGVDINDCLRVLGKPETINSSQVVTLTFYTDAKIIVLSDYEGNVTAAFYDSYHNIPRYL